MKILGLPGSLREGSRNAQLLRLVKEVAGDGHDVEIGSLKGIPLYDGDVEAAGIPESVEAMATAIRDADALYVTTPEYNYGVPGVVKNWVDWISRVKPLPFAGKPVALAGAAAGMLGTAMAQRELRHTLTMLNADVLGPPLVLVAKAHEALDEPSDMLRDLIGKQLAKLAERVG